MNTQLRLHVLISFEHKYSNRLLRQIYKANKKKMCVYCHMLKKIRVGRSEMLFFLILFFITKLMLDGI